MSSRSEEQSYVQISSPMGSGPKRGSIITPRVDANEGVGGIGSIPIRLHNSGWVRIKQMTDGNGRTWLEIEVEED